MFWFSSQESDELPSSLPTPTDFWEIRHGRDVVVFAGILISVVSMSVVIVCRGLG